MTQHRKVSELQPGDMIDLEGIDISEANEQIWPVEYASVESVSTATKGSGGWCDGYLRNAEFATAYAIIYTDNGAAPAVVPADATFEILQHREPFTGPDAAQVQR